MIRGYIGKADLISTWRREFKYNPSAVQPSRFRGSIKIYDDENGNMRFSKADALKIALEWTETDASTKSSETHMNHTLWKYYLNENKECKKSIAVGE